MDGAAGPVDQSEIPICEFRLPEACRPQDRPFVEDTFDFNVFDATRERVHPLFRNIPFGKAVELIDRKFPFGLSFVNCTFDGNVSFDKSVFDGPAYFWGCRFFGEFSFFRVLVTVKSQPVQLREPGEVNFSYCQFNQRSEAPKVHRTLKQPNFSRAIFEGVCFFHRTVFADGASIEETRFQGGARFESFPADICISRKSIDKVPDDKLEKLEELPRAVLSTNTDHREDHINFNSNIRSVRALRRAVVKALTPVDTRPHRGDTGAEWWSERLGRLWRMVTRPHEVQAKDLLTGGGFEQLEEAWKSGYNVEMFADGASDGRLITTSFRGTQFGPKSWFSHVNLSTCLFLGAGVSGVDFQVVKWSRQPCGLVLRRIIGFFIDLRAHPVWIRSWRSALRDELELDRKVNSLGPDGNDFRNMRRELSELYRELRTAFDHEGDSDTARDFYFGELEADRLALPWLQRNFGLSHLYKALSGYSRREGLALSWLLAAIFVVFPLLFFRLVNQQEHWQFQTPFNNIAPAAYIDDAPDLLIRMPSHPCALSAITTTPDEPSPSRSTGHAHSSAEPSPGSSQDAAALPPSLLLLNQDRYFNALTRADDTVWGNGSTRSKALRAITASLQASTFFPSTTEDHSIDTAIQTMQSVRCPNGNVDQKAAAAGLSGLEYRRRLIAAIERLLVPAQLALFLLALRSRFQRSH